MDRKRVIGSATISAWRNAAVFLGTALVVLVLAAPAAYPAEPEPPCRIPDALALKDISLPAAKSAAATDKRLVVLTFGGVRPNGVVADLGNASFPARLSAELGAALPQIEVKVANEPPPGKTSSDVPAALPGLIAKTGAKLVIWGPGGRDMMARIDLGVFAEAIKGGIAAARDSGADLILMDTAFLPAPNRMEMIEPYRERVLSAAEADHVPLLRRHGLMLGWSQDGTLDLAVREPADRQLVAGRLFSCVAQSLAAPIAAAVR